MIKSTGVVRKIDELGRVVIPKEIVRTLGLKNKNKATGEKGSVLEFFIEGDRIILKEYKPGCHCCEKVDGKLTEVMGIKLCDECIAQFEKARKIIDSLR